MASSRSATDRLLDSKLRGCASRSRLEGKPIEMRKVGCHFLQRGIFCLEIVYLTFEKGLLDFAKGELQQGEGEIF